jgi:hypothetical protein
MSQDHRHDTGPEHRECSTLIPWYVNDTIGDHERQRLEAHLLLCAGCRETLAHERGVFQGMTAETTLEYMPAASLKRLNARLDGLDGAAPADLPADSPANIPVAGVGRRRSMPWPGVMAASVAVIAVALSLLAADRWVQFRARTAAPNYYTVTTATPRAPDEVIRAVFSPAITLVELQAILDEAGLRIISGPTEAGVYSLAAKTGRPVSGSLAQLRGHAQVRFAESTQSNAGPGHTP